jgi:hypothetical protein
MSTLIREGRFTRQLKGAIGEVALRTHLAPFGKVEKLPVQRGKGERTADFKVTLTRDYKCGKLLFRKGEVLICEGKMGSNKRIMAELATPDSHGRQQLRMTIEREGAAGGIIFVPMEMQTKRLWVDARKAEMAENPTESRSTIFMPLPHEGAMLKGVRLAAEELTSSSVDGA